MFPSHLFFCPAKSNSEQSRAEKTVATLKFESKTVNKMMFPIKTAAALLLVFSFPIDAMKDAQTHLRRADGPDCSDAQDFLKTECQELATYSYVGCFADRKKRAFSIDFGNKKSKDECFNICKEGGYHYFARQWEGRCSCLGYAEYDDTYTKYGTSNDCTCDNEENQGEWSNCVYAIKYPTPEQPKPWHFVGCYKDRGNRAMPHFVDDFTSDFECYNECKDNGFKFFGKQWYGECWCGADRGYKKYGQAQTCKCDGNRSSAWKNCVYAIDK